MVLFLALKPPRRLFLFGAVSLILVLSFLAWFIYERGKASPAQAVLPLSGLVVGLDPGHGGYDPGTKQGEIEEKDIVLQISLYLREYLQQGGARVVMTRDTDRDLLELPAAGPKKKLDMSNRLLLLENGGVDLLVSIHANSFSASLWRGAQTFYQEGREDGKMMADIIQTELIRILQNTDRMIKSGDYFLLREMDIPGVLVEVGFLSNPQELQLLLAPGYQKKVAWAIYTGIIKFLTLP